MTRGVTLVTKHLLRFFSLGLLLAGCDMKGCAGQPITLIYRDVATFDAHAPVFKDDQAIGYIAAVTQTSEGIRLHLLIRDPSQIHTHDLYRPLEPTPAHRGLKIVHQGGEPLIAGAIVYFPPRFEPGSDVTFPAEKEPEKSLFSFFRDEPKNAQTVETQPEPQIRFDEDTYTRSSIRRALSVVKDSTKWPPSVESQMNELVKITNRPGTDHDVIQAAKQHLPGMRTEIVRLAADARRRGDEAATREYVEALRQVLILEERVQRFQRLAQRPLRRHEP